MRKVKPLLVKPETLLTIDEGYILTYPSREPDLLRSRVSTLKRLGVNLVEFTGPKEVGGLRVLGKGTRSIVLKAWVSGRKYALKLRRPDSQVDFRKEAESLSLANRVGVGPRLVSYMDDVIVMELVEGKPISEWVETLSEGSWEALKTVLREAVLDAYKLDRIGLDHGELSRASKHVYVKPDGAPVILDFGSSSMRRKPSNVTSLVQYLFIGSPIARQIQALRSPVDRSRLLKKLRAYKEKPSRETLNVVLRTLSLKP